MLQLVAFSGNNPSHSCSVTAAVPSSALTWRIWSKTGLPLSFSSLLPLMPSFCPFIFTHVNQQPKRPLYNNLEWYEHTQAFPTISYFERCTGDLWWLTLTLKMLKEYLQLDPPLRWQTPSDLQINQLLRGTTLAHYSEQLTPVISLLSLRDEQSSTVKVRFCLASTCLWE